MIMRMFLGAYSPSLTNGSRIALPKQLRDLMRGGEVILSRGFEPCIFIFDKNDWEDEMEKQKEESVVSETTRKLTRYLHASAHKVPIDSQGRVVLPSELQRFAGITKTTAVIGAGSHVEVWDKKTWDAYFKKISEEYGAHEQKLV